MSVYSELPRAYRYGECKKAEACEVCGDGTPAEFTVEIERGPDGWLTTEEVCRECLEPGVPVVGTLRPVSERYGGNQ